MTTLVPRSDIERLVQRRRHQTAHIARRVGDVVYLLHSLDCLERGDDLRLCDYSHALDELLAPDIAAALGIGGGS